MTGVIELSEFPGDEKSETREWSASPLDSPLFYLFQSSTVH